MTIWVQSDMLTDGTGYTVAVHYDDDHSRVLDRDTALAYATELHKAATRAEHDAAVLAQLATLGMDDPARAHVLQHLRADRPPLDDAVLAPLQLTPGVSASTGTGFLSVAIAGRLAGQWAPDDARGHASHVLDALTASDLDAAYRRYLIGTVGLETTQANQVVVGLAAHLSEAGHE